MSFDIQGYVGSLGFSKGMEGAGGEGYRIFQEEIPGVGLRLLILIMEGCASEIPTDLLPGICKAVYYDAAGEVLGTGEWLVFGSDTPIPMGYGVKPVFAVVLENIRL